MYTQFVNKIYQSEELEYMSTEKEVANYVDCVRASGLTILN